MELDQMTVVVSGGSGVISYQWQSSADGINGWAECSRNRSNNSYLYTIKCNCRNNILQSTGQCCKQWLRPGSK